MTQQDLLPNPIVYLENLTIDSNFSSISGEARLCEVFYDSAFKPIDRVQLFKTQFTLKNQGTSNFHVLLKAHAENLILKYFIDKGKNCFVYDYTLRSFEVKNDTDVNFVGNTYGIFYSDKENLREEEQKDGTDRI